MYKNYYATKKNFKIFLRTIDTIIVSKYYYSIKVEKPASTINFIVIFQCS